MKPLTGMKPLDDFLSEQLSVLCENDIYRLKPEDYGKTEASPELAEALLGQPYKDYLASVEKDFQDNTGRRFETFKAYLDVSLYSYDEFYTKAVDAVVNALYRAARASGNPLLNEQLDNFIIRYDDEYYYCNELGERCSSLDEMLFREIQFDAKAIIGIDLHDYEEQRITESAKTLHAFVKSQVEALCDENGRYFVEPTEWIKQDYTDEMLLELYKSYLQADNAYLTSEGVHSFEDYLNNTVVSDNALNTHFLDYHAFHEVWEKVNEAIQADDTLKVAFDSYMQSLPHEYLFNDCADMLYEAGFRGASFTDAASVTGRDLQAFEAEYADKASELMQEHSGIEPVPIDLEDLGDFEEVPDAPKPFPDRKQLREERLNKKKGGGERE